jgi:hypothetical protein
MHCKDGLFRSVKLASARYSALPMKGDMNFNVQALLEWADRP